MSSTCYTYNTRDINTLLPGGTAHIRSFETTACDWLQCVQNLINIRMLKTYRRGILWVFFVPLLPPIEVSMKFTIQRKVLVSPIQTNIIWIIPLLFTLQTEVTINSYSEVMDITAIILYKLSDATRNTYTISFAVSCHPLGILNPGSGQAGQIGAVLPGRRCSSCLHSS